jgi:hypothetical protein
MFCYIFMQYRKVWKVILLCNGELTQHMFSAFGKTVPPKPIKRFKGARAVIHVQLRFQLTQIHVFFYRAITVTKTAGPIPRKLQRLLSYRIIQGAR